MPVIDLFSARAAAARMARIYARVNFGVTGVTTLCGKNLRVILRNPVASRARSHTFSVTGWDHPRQRRNARILA
jgi:hypothetical protein